MKKNLEVTGRCLRKQSIQVLLVPFAYGKTFYVMAFSLIHTVSAAVFVIV